MDSFYRLWHAARTLPLFILALLVFTPHLFGQAALLLEQPYGFFGTINPTGHAAVYLNNVCAETPVHLRLCGEDEAGVVISRYKGMAGYDWIAIPLVPYLYAVNDSSSVPPVVDQETVYRLRDSYREHNLGELARALPEGGFFTGGWTELSGAAYDRQMYAFRFATTRAQDEELVRKLNARRNRSHFNMFFNNCSDFDRFILNNYFPGKFRRTVFPDAGITTPKHITYTLKKYAARHPEVQLAVFAIPQIPGSRRKSRDIHGVAESMVINGYVLPIVLFNPYIAGGLVADYLIHGRYKLVPSHPEVLGPRDLEPLTGPTTVLNEALTRPAPSPDNLEVSTDPLEPAVSSEDAAAIQTDKQ